MDETTKPNQPGGARLFLRRAAAVHWGEGSLWTLFAISWVLGALNGNETAAIFAGVAALGAIGVRATRAEDRQP